MPLVVAVLALSLAALVATAQEASIPPAPTRWVTDNAALLSPDTARALDQRLEAYQRHTGHQVVVWTGQSIGTTPLEDFAVKTFEAWRLGRKGVDDGVLMLVLAADRKIAIEVGYGLEDRLPDARASRIVREVMAPKLRAGDADGAVTAGVDAVLNAIDGKPFVETPPPAAQPHPGRILLLVLLGIAFLVLLVTNPALALHLLFIVGSGRGGLGGGSNGGFSGGGGRSGGGGARGSW